MDPTIKRVTCFKFLGVIPKSTNRTRCFTSLTVLLPTSGKLARGIWEINREKIVVLIVTLFKNIQ